MKHFLIISLIILSLNSIIAQDNNRNQKLSGGFEIRYLKTTKVGAEDLRSADFSGTYGKSLRLNLGWFYNPHIYTGLSFGADRYEVAAANTFPLTLNVRYYLKDTRNTFYTFAEGGPILALTPASDKGYMSALGVGYKFFVSKKTCLTATIGYNYEKSKLNGTGTFGNYISRKSILFSMGMHF